ncbi:siderophore-interacting protein, partial [Kineococcus glutinatus]|uniref:siderophore-interacting protein n=1 Tax=Kineococcus glutinatus TaxID=1070872 RepID=UPI0031EEBFCB
MTTTAETWVGSPVELHTHPLVPRVLTVARVEPLTHRMVRVVLTGDDLAGFTTIAPEDHVKLFPPPAGSTEPRLPTIENDRWVDRAADADLVNRDYTVRSYDPDARELSIDMVLHPHGPGGRWAAQAAPGQRIGVLGPRGSFLVRDVLDWYVFAVDETSLPAMARWLERLRPGVPVTAFVEVDDARDEIELPTRADARVTWLHRGGVPAGRSDVLERAVRALPLPAGTGFVWVAGESGSIKPLRRYLSRELGLDRDHFDVDGYWKLGAADHDHHHDEDEEHDEDEGGA